MEGDTAGLRDVSELDTGTEHAAVRLVARSVVWEEEEDEVRRRLARSSLRGPSVALGPSGHAALRLALCAPPACKLARRLAPPRTSRRSPAILIAARRPTSMSRPPTRRPASPSSPSSPEFSTRPLPARQYRPTSSVHEHRLAELRTALDSDPELADALWTVVADLRGRGVPQSSRAGEGHAAVEHERGAAGAPSRSRSRSRLPRSPSSPSSGFSSTSTSPERDAVCRAAIRAGATAGRDRRGAARRRDELLSEESASSSEEDGHGSPARPLLARQGPRDEADTGRRRRDSAAGTSRSKSRTTVSGCQGASPPRVCHATSDYSQGHD